MSVHGAAPRWGPPLHSPGVGNSPPHLHLTPALPAHRYWFTLSQFPPQLNGVPPVCSISPQESGVWPLVLSGNLASLPGPEHPPLPPDAYFMPSPHTLSPQPVIFPMTVLPEDLH